MDNVSLRIISPGRVEHSIESIGREGGARGGGGKKGLKPHGIPGSQISLLTYMYACKVAYFHGCFCGCVLKYIYTPPPAVKGHDAGSALSRRVRSSGEPGHNPSIPRGKGHGADLRSFGGYIRG